MGKIQQIHENVSISVSNSLQTETQLVKHVLIQRLWTALSVKITQLTPTFLTMVDAMKLALLDTLETALLLLVKVVTLIALSAMENYQPNVQHVMCQTDTLLSVLTHAYTQNALVCSTTTKQPTIEKHVALCARTVMGQLLQTALTALTPASWTPPTTPANCVLISTLGSSSSL